MEKVPLLDPQIGKIYRESLTRCLVVVEAIRASQCMVKFTGNDSRHESSALKVGPLSDRLLTCVLGYSVMGHNSYARAGVRISGNIICLKAEQKHPFDLGWYITHPCESHMNFQVVYELQHIYSQTTGYSLGLNEVVLRTITAGCNKALQGKGPSEL